ncbi:MAG: transcriptional regulator [Acetobacteraceae bacterium]|nr:MAG: transcriptional regulator [Acetobacteraceae bacterium]
MPRTRTVPDDLVFATIQRLLDQGGDKAVSFGSVGRATGLAPPTLVQRYVNRERMVRAARAAAWDALERRTAAAIANTADKGPQGLLKAIGPVDAASIAADLRDPELAARAAGWRAGMETALTLRLGGGQRARESAALLFAAWQGQSLWTAAGETAFRLKDVVKRLT